jgi:hypothetical protein
MYMWRAEKAAPAGATLPDAEFLNASRFQRRLELLNRGQRWVVRKIGEQIATIADRRLKAFLKVMADSHDINIGALDQALAEGKL